MACLVLHPALQAKLRLTACCPQIPCMLWLLRELCLAAARCPCHEVYPVQGKAGHQPLISLYQSPEAAPRILIAQIAKTYQLKANLVTQVSRLCTTSFTEDQLEGAFTRSVYKEQHLVQYVRTDVHSTSGKAVYYV